MPEFSTTNSRAGCPFGAHHLETSALRTAKLRDKWQQDILRFDPGVSGSVIVEPRIAGFTIGTPSALMSREEWCNAARDYAETRRQFERSLCEFQGLQWKFADMVTRLDATQLLL